MPSKQMRSKASPARQAALEVGAAARIRKAYTHGLIVSQIETAPLSPEDRAFATKLALGVAATWGTLDEIIDRCLHSPTDVKDDVRDALRISIYEMYFLDKDDHAAVDQGVELVKVVTPKATGLANAMLRKAAKMKESFPFGDVKTDSNAFARSVAFPSWLANMLVEELGDEAARSFMLASNEQAPLFIAVNEIYAKEDEVKAVFVQAGATVTEVKGLDRCLRISDPRVLGKPEIRRLFDEGKILASDAASQMIAQNALPSQYPETYYEVGAGRGTKSILLQNAACKLFGKQMPLVAIDNHEFKTKLLAKRAKEYGVVLDQAYTQDATKLHEFLGVDSADAVFIDAPCSGLGTLRRHPEIRWRLKPKDIDALAELGYSMLESAAQCIKPGGLLVYSTCTVTRAENERLIQRFLSSDSGKDFTIDPIGGRTSLSLRLSHGSSDAHFAVRMVRKRRVG